ncbi:unnamed protein product [Effrenium voratum]|nr:unnamed protein product [Effrenium voratum]
MQVAFFLAFLGLGLAERHVSLHRLDQAAGFVGALKEPPAEGESEAKGRKSAFLQVTALALCGGAWCGIAMNASKDKDSPATGDFVKFRNGMQALGEVHCHSDPVTLSFMNPELEKLYTSSNAEVICKRLRPICGALLLYVLIVCAFSEQHDGSIVLNPALFKLSSTASIVYCFAAAIMVLLTVALLVFSFFPSFQRSKVLEPCVIAWIFVIILCGWVFFYRWTLAAFNGRDPEREFVSNGFDGEYIASLEIFAVYFCIHTPLRFKLLAPLVAPLPFLYLATVLCFGSPEGMQHHQLHVIQGEKVGQFDFLADELELSLLMALLLYLVLWGKYVHERSSRTSFLSMWESFQMVQELSGQDSSQAATGVGKASEALRQALAKLDALASWLGPPETASACFS